MLDTQKDFKKYSFKNDYSEGAHINILNALIKTNLEQQEGYGEDYYCIEATNIIKSKLQNKRADIHFVSGGTQANLIVIAAALKPYESVIAAGTGHINVHEAGAIENTGHKINVVDTIDGKLKKEDIAAILKQHNDEHMVKPRLVFISNSTEIGTIYNKKELEDLYSFCKEKELYLYLDGARLGAALSSDYNDMSLFDLSSLVDAFYIGGTKNGALLGEAIVINNDKLKQDFRYYLKQNGALLAKGRIIGIQFVELFKNDLYFNMARHANNMAAEIAKSIKELGYAFLTNPSTNQIFPILPNDLIYRLQNKYSFYVWSKIDDCMSAVRIVTSWATSEEATASFIKDLK